MVRDSDSDSSVISSSLSAVTSAAAAPLLHRGGTRRGRTSAGAARRRSGRHRADAFPAASGGERHVTKRVGPFPRQESINLLQEFVIDPAIQGVPSKLRLCYVDLDFECSTVCLTLLGLMGIWQKWLGSWARWWNTEIKVNPTQVSAHQGTPCSFGESVPSQSKGPLRDWLTLLRSLCFRRTKSNAKGSEFTCKSSS